MRLAGIVALALGLSAEPAVAQTVEAPAQPNYVAVGFNVGGNGDLVVVAWLYPVRGKVAVCGAVFPEKESMAIAARQTDILKDVVFDLEGKTLSARATDFSKFANEEAAVASRKGRCSVTNVAWRDDYAKVQVGIDGRRGYIRG